MGRVIFANISTITQYYRPNYLVFTEDEIIGWCSADNDTEAAVYLVFDEPKVVFNLTLRTASVGCHLDSSSVLERFKLMYIDPMDPDAILRTYDTVTIFISDRHINLYWANSEDDKLMKCFLS